MKHNRVRHRIQSIGLGFLSGYVDTVGFIALFGLFTGHITGNFVLIGAALVEPQGGPVLLKILAFPAFIVGVASARLLIAGLIKRDRHALLYGYALQLILLTAFMVLGYLATPTGSEPSDLAIAAGIVGAMAMGAHNACGRLLLPHIAPTGMMTGNVTQLVIDTLDVLRGTADLSSRRRFIKYLWPVISFGTAAVSAAFVYSYTGFFALLLPIAILIFLMLVERKFSKRIQKNQQA